MWLRPLEQHWCDRFVGIEKSTYYEHQKKAMACLDKMNRPPAYNTLVILPTGGVKTYTASMWFLKNALDRQRTAHHPRRTDHLSFQALYNSIN